MPSFVLPRSLAAHYAATRGRQVRSTVSTLDAGSLLWPATECRVELFEGAAGRHRLGKVRVEVLTYLGTLVGR